MTDETPPRAPRWTLWLPLALFVGFVALVMSGLLRPDDRAIESAMVGKPLPDFTLKPGVPERPGLSAADFRQGKPRLLNFFASWCVPCAVEAPQLAKLAAHGVEIHGIAWRDRQDQLSAFLARHGNPFVRIGADETSEAHLKLGASGVPETFVIDGKGVIRYQHIGDIRAEHVPMLLEELRKAER